ncbi:methyl-accepting chemotaxis protein [Silvanigrella aquatica]|uniref:Methyl-accepting transducer domain-containing protein n=1 Tax=Silvanigrella aquatica TaxID=1915309 RepID=A0A1L4CYU5_9BACT|nr:methyl-accepting chemotaxis protein [Silvanigrella aquatica]APJ03126.1 hypothetical protein AXG55_04070 [Silvanigrella aquatica]
MFYKIMNSSLKVKIFILNISGIIILGITFVILSFMNFNSQEELIKNKLFLTSDNLSDSIQDQFYERYGDVKTFSLHFKNFTTNSREYVNYLNQIVKFYGIYSIITVCDLNGRLLSVNDESPDGKKINSEILYKDNFSKTNWFQETIQKKFLEDTKKDFTGVNFQDAYFDDYIEKVYKEKTYSTTFSTFIYNSKGDPIGIISTHPNFSWVEAVVTRVYDNYLKSNYKSFQVTLLNKSGDVILDYNPSQNNDKKEIQHDEKILNSYNLLKAGQPAAEKLFQGEEGTLESKNSRTGNNQIQAFKKVIGPKIVDELGWKVLVRVNASEVYSTIINSKITFFISFILIFSLIVFMSLFFSKNLGEKLKMVARNLAVGNQKLNKTSSGASVDSQQLSASAIEQAAALQETVTAVNQINAMMNKTSEMASISRKKSDENKSKVTKGKNIVRNMVESISNIKSSNTNIMDQVIEGNKRISEIVKVIAEIESKTKVINEIVFQTKLLSFNASVEAARAGEHGRGFSVVAEEVGNLAQMSGNASKEISSMLENSIHKVTNIIDDTKVNIEKILNISKDAMKSGEDISKECALIFEEIFDNTEEVNNLVYEIANSAQEQAKGVNEITHAMHELDSVTHQNSNIAQKSAQTAEELLNQSYEIEQMASHLLKIIDGDNISSTGIDKDKGTPNSGHNLRQFQNLNTQNYEAKSDKFKVDGKKATSIKPQNTPQDVNGKVKTPQPDEVPSYNDPRFEEL